MRGPTHGRTPAADLWANAAAADPRPSESFGSIGFIASSFQKYGIFTFKISEFHGCGRFHGFVVSQVSETILGMILVPFWNILAFLETFWLHFEAWRPLG